MAQRFNPRVLNREVREFVEKRIGAMAANIVDDLYRETPKDTSWAASNWHSQKGSPPVTSRESKGDPSTAKSTQDSQKAQLRSFKLSDRSIYIQNSVPYIERLNSGWSRQAPAGFVDEIVRKARI